ncbi:photosynthetic/respiratory NAD(P)H-quinone oxidoreductase subunit K [Tychonema sp. LEGE 06208]|uniref:photosynthetic/respiratory NAD(P)H-quinone oxidoreductase subunit K n=1 Tax=Tychonema sp. LEGE 06208 TaxID=1828663 RepID=UPI00187F6A72|nr:photosynthetic/respiratory NAD(P)H-quinone oxidoreductase subunit K [Tychonema sp. LEGE 06208]MBE9162288.1 photosynthetic/respiratory NAD(P)H-quinone oxidoreductase subunit K [Tychonema sp. LEGE 06208]
MVLSSDTSQKSLIVNPAERPQVTSELSENVILTTVDDIYNWARLSSLWPLLYGTACCFIEFAALIGSRFDFDRFGLVPRSSPRQADLLITAGTITMKYAPILVRLYEQMPEPKYVIAMGACTITGGMFSVDSPTAVRGVDKLIPVDVYIPGCPPRPEAIIDAIIKLRKKIANDSMQERGNLLPTHRYYTRPHKMKVVDDILDGKYLSVPGRMAPPKELTEAMGMPVPPALLAGQKQEVQRG